MAVDPVCNKQVDETAPGGGRAAVILSLTRTVAKQKQGK